MNSKRNMVLTHVGDSKDEVLKSVNFEGSIRAKDSFIFNEPKGELFKLSKEVLEKEGNGRAYICI
ncbi:hypothetical protein K5V21_12680 [Clostridium sardiniense]|uniref:Uncharacterized protein n=1 Tax=Clostridium sardiniense TaxID=29369 RepID=A0ABS7L0B5_CLOSR|nr:hypothetical protein [Clostridium sardiniense]MBY0756303.1 hypothetical protein [Clostridium sardiniense]MDQ0461458.1 hypothetical protein [Clostridium sardiniense]